MRSKQAPRRIVEPDLIYNSTKVARLINRSMKDGKKDTAAKQVYQALEMLEAKTKRPALEAFEEALNNIMPKMEVRSRRVGGAAYQVPVPVRGNRAFSLAVRWLVIEANKRPNKEFHTYADKLAAELYDALNNEGGSIQKRLTSHKMADANKAFAHFKW